MEQEKLLLLYKKMGQEEILADIYQMIVECPHDRHEVIETLQDLAKYIEKKYIK